ncbi:MAG: carbonic anhydrase [Myxococcales bacterium]
MTARLRSLPALLAALPALAASPALAQHSEAAHPWSYDGAHGPTHWGDLKPEYATCKRGKHQTPIDIRGAKIADLPAIEFSYAPSPFRILDNGHSVQVNPGAGNFITVGGKRYDLVQFHFHHPSEERIEGKAFPLVAHLVHEDADGKLAVVAVLLRSGGENPFVEDLWKDLPADVEEEHASKTTVDLLRLLPAKRGYYTFAGSLTTPPCSEDVTWFVLKQAVAISKSELATFAKKYSHNARPIQPLNGRAVQASK